MKEKIYSIYTATNSVNGRVYVGATGDFEKRKYRHSYSSYGGNTLFSKALQEFGFSSFDWQIVYQSKDKDHIFKNMEGYFIDLFCSCELGYNAKASGSSQKAKPVFRKISEVSRGEETVVEKLNNVSSDKGKSVEEIEIEEYFNCKTSQESCSETVQELREKSRPCRYCGDNRKTAHNGKLLCNTCFPSGEFLSAAKIKKKINK